MLYHPRRAFLSLLMAILFFLSGTIPASAELKRNSKGVFMLDCGGSIFIPTEFNTARCQEENEPGEWDYLFTRSDQDMSIELAVFSLLNYDMPWNEMIDILHESLLEDHPDPVFQEKSEDNFTMSGYLDDRIYYILAVAESMRLYCLLFDYPTANRDVCDPIVVKVCDSFAPDDDGDDEEDDDDMLYSEDGTWRETCPLCGGKKYCKYCNGGGQFLNTYGRDPYYQLCPFCWGLGHCTQCVGRGYITHSSK